MPNQHLSPEDRAAREMGYKDAATYLAWQRHQEMIRNLPDTVMQPQPKPQAQAVPPHDSSIWDTILSYLPLGGAMQKAGKALDGKK